MTKILAIEDESPILDNILEILEVNGLEAHGALGGHEGIQKAHQLMPDIILCDINMPEMDGYSVLMSLRSDPRTSRIPFVFLTAYVDRAFQRKAMKLGAEDYLTKPFHARELLDVVNTQIQKRQIIVDDYKGEIDILRHNILSALPHEMRTPLTGIITSADLLLMDFDENMPPKMERIEQMLRIIHGAGQRLQRLIENYLVYTQIELFRNAPEQHPHLTADEGINDLHRVILTAAQQACDEMGRSGDLVFGELVNGVAVCVNERNLNKMVFELVSNAFKFSEPGTPVHIDCTINEDACVLNVVDNGKGMTPEQISQIGAYMQFNRGLQEQQGLGLGLVIVERLAELHNGSLMLATASPHGLRATVRLPLLDE